MNEKPISSLITDVVPPECFTVINGLGVQTDPGLAQLRRYLPVLAVIAAPYAGLGGDQDPLIPFDRAGEWHLLAQALDAAAQAQPGSAPFALVRLVPPTARQLARALAADGPDAFRVVHFVCHGERDMLHLEDEDGHEAYEVVDHLVRLFEPSRAQLVIMEGCFSPNIAELLIQKTRVEAVIGTRRKLLDEHALAFAARLYGDLAAGVGVRLAFQAAVDVLVRTPGAGAERYELVLPGDLPDVRLVLPSPGVRAARPLLDGGLPRLAGVPQWIGFAGRREALSELARDVPAANKRLYAITGPAGIGKSRLAAEWVRRFGWRFPGGVLWFRVARQTTAHEVIAALVRFLDLPATTPPDEVCERMQARGVLLVLDHADALQSGEEAERLAGWLRELNPESGACVLLTARRFDGPLAQIRDTWTHELGELSYKAARTLAMRQAVARGLEALDVDTIDDFLDRAHNQPWLIVKGVRLIESGGLEAALADLEDFRPDMSDPLETYLGGWIKRLELEPDGGALEMLARAQSVPDAFDIGLAEAIGGGQAENIVRVLVGHSLLRREGALLTIPPTVRDYLQQHYPLSPSEHDLLIEIIALHLARTWPDPQDDTPVPTREQQARLNNVRGVIPYFVRPDSALDALTGAAALIAAAPAYRAAGLGQECLVAAGAIRERLPEGLELARLQVAMGEALHEIPGQQKESGWLFQVSLTIGGLDVTARADMARVYGRFLCEVGQAEAAEKLYSEALRALLRDQSEDVTLAACLAHDWGNVLASLARFDEATARYKAALAGYAEMQRADLSVEAQRDMARMMRRQGAVQQAEDLLRRALASVEQTGPPRLEAAIRSQLAAVCADRAWAAHRAGQTAISRAEWGGVEQMLSDAVAALLRLPASEPLAEVYHELGRVQARLTRLDDGAANVARSIRLYDQIGMLPEIGAAAVTLGQLCMAQGDSVTAQAALHHALDVAAALDDPELAARAAGVLVRVHQIRARHLARGSRAFRQNMIDQASFSRAVLAGLGLGEHIAALDEIIVIAGGTPGSLQLGEGGTA
ncbi:MAG: NACHT domain-containing protein [Anaerolineae bacterium]|nr:NACHT domain-containing protein [Anaerolineae bacterium]